MRPQFIIELENLGACPAAIRFAAQCESFKEAWAACENHGWIAWLICTTQDRAAIHKFVKWMNRKYPLHVSGWALRADGDVPWFEVCYMVRRAYGDTKLAAKALKSAFPLTNVPKPRWTWQ